MIRVPRRQKDDRGRIIEPDVRWFREARHLGRKAEREGAAHEPNEHYRHAQVKTALEKLFNGKCAYCETRLADSAWNVEHYRPKRRIRERPDHPGYYWLTYTWTNLYPACVPCNQRRKDAPHWDSPRGSAAQGKFDQFPIDDESMRAMSPADSLADELPYLLDPCEDDPSLYLCYGIQGEIDPIDDDIFGEKTIEICHLRRYRLTIGRAKKIVKLVELLKTRAAAVAARVDEVVASLDRMIEAECARESEHAGLARAVIADPAAFGAPTRS